MRHPFLTPCDSIHAKTSQRHLSFTLDARESHSSTLTLDMKNATLKADMPFSRHKKTRHHLDVRPLLFFGNSNAYLAAASLA